MDAMTARIAQLERELAEARRVGSWESAEKHSAQAAEERVRNENYALRQRCEAAEADAKAAREALAEGVRLAGQLVIHFRPGADACNWLPDSCALITAPEFPSLSPTLGELRALAAWHRKHAGEAK